MADIYHEAEPRPLAHFQPASPPLSSLPTSFDPLVNMISMLLLAALAATSTAISPGRRGAEELFTIELAPGVVKQVTEAEKYALKAVSRLTVP